MHIEGHELLALKGADDVIKKFRPILMMTIYHNELGLWKLVHYINGIVPKYKFFLRLDSYCGTGLVLYCIPEER